MAKQQFQTEINQLLHLMIHSLYSNKEIFLRELISNSSDAIDKLNYLVLTDEAFKDLAFNPQIEIKADKEANTLTIIDSGIGMNEEELVKNLGTIANSGTKAFVEQLSGDAKKDSNLIGQFGVGFYSAFMVASKVEVLSKKAGEESAYLWVSSSEEGSFEISQATKEGYGTTITLHLREEDKEFLETYRIEGIIKKYSNHIPYPIFMDKMHYPEATEGEDEPKGELQSTQINAAKALWTKSKNDLSQEDYDGFYESLAHSNEKPLAHAHNRAEGTLEYSTLFYLPEKAPFDMFRADYKSGVKLYIKRVFITDDDKELLPTHLRFVRGIVDSEDLPLNVSREILQHNPILEKIKKASVKNIYRMIKSLSDDKYRMFWDEFGKVIKEGIANPTEQEKIYELCRFDTNKREFITLDEYLSATEDKTIYYLIGKDKELLKNSPLLENSDKEVLILSDEIDEFIEPMLTKYQEAEFKALGKSEVEDKSESYTELLEKIKTTLGEAVKEVKMTSRLKDSASVLIYEDSGNLQMEAMMKEMGMEVPNRAPILELNPENALVKSLGENYSDDVASVLFAQAQLLAGESIQNPKEFVEKLNKLIVGA